MGATRIRYIPEDMIFKLKGDQLPRNDNLRALEWAVITQVDGSKNVGQIKKILSLTDEEVKKIFQKLLDENLIEVVGKPVNIDYISTTLIDDIQQDLTYFMGPVAEIVLEETIGGLNASRSKFPREKLSLLIELLSNQISNPKKRYEFLERSLEKLYANL